jgi:hypothetical protein
MYNEHEELAGWFMLDQDQHDEQAVCVVGAFITLNSSGNLVLSTCKQA